MTTHIYLDVDGVINAISSNPPKQNTGWKGKWVTGKGQTTVGVSAFSAEDLTIREFPILWSTELIAAINELAARDDVTIFWLTTWREDAQKSIGPLVGLTGSENWGVVDSGDEHDFDNWWKLTSIKAHVTETNPDKVVWLDDDIGYDKKARNWLHTSPSILGVTPQSPHGLTKKDIKTIVEFIDKN